MWIWKIAHPTTKSIDTNIIESAKLTEKSWISFFSALWWKVINLIKPEEISKINSENKDGLKPVGHSVQEKIYIVFLLYLIYYNQIKYCILIKNHFNFPTILLYPYLSLQLSLFFFFFRVSLSCHVRNHIYFFLNLMIF